jgi:hypothetical protein
MVLVSVIFLNKIGSRTHSDQKFDQRGEGVISMAGKKGS